MNSASSFHDVSILSFAPEQRSEAENRWVSFQPYLLEKGYNLRPRYQPDWVPSWTITNAHPADCEDSAESLSARVLDATRISDQRQVMIKMLVPAENDREGEDELALLQYFSTPPLNEDSHNHIVPCLDSFPIPEVDGGTFVVMPLLSKYKYPPFYDLSEVLDFLNQLFEGLLLMHKHNVAHCDIASPNIMMDSRPLYGESFHPFLQHRSIDGRRYIHPKYLRSQRHIRYYYIDLGYAKWFRDSHVPRTLVGARARERAPEQKRGQPYNPFLADVYQLGAMIRRDLIPKISTLDFLLPLARDMTEREPGQRPTLEAAQHTMNTLFVGLSGWRRRWPIIPRDARFTHRCIYVFAGVSTEVVLFFKRLLQLLVLWRW